jgi:hypothetical protein
VSELNLITRKIKVSMTPEVWRLLDMYRLDTDYRAKKGKYGHVTQCRLIGAILTWWMALERMTIYDGYLRAKLQQTRELAERIAFGDIDALEAASGCDLPEGMRARAHARARAEFARAEEQGAVRGDDWGPESPLLRAAGRPDEIRGGDFGAGTAAGVGGAQPEQPEQAGDLAAGPRRAGLDEAQALLAWARSHVLENLATFTSGAGPSHP